MPHQPVGHFQLRNRGYGAASITSPDPHPGTPIVIAGLLMLTIPLLLPRPDRGTNPSRRRAGLPAF